MFMVDSVESRTNTTYIFILADNMCMHFSSAPWALIRNLSHAHKWQTNTCTQTSRHVCKFTHTHPPLSHCAVSLSVLCPPQVRLQMLSLPLWSSPTPQIEMCVSKSRQPHLADTVCAQTVASLTLALPSMFLVRKFFFASSGNVG